MQHFDVYGMTCAACSARVEKAVRGVEGVSVCSVNLLTNSMVVDGSATQSAIVKAVEKVGYRAVPQASTQGSPVDSDVSDEHEKTEYALKQRLLFSILILLVLMYVSMGHTMLGFPLFSFLENNIVALGIVQMLLCIAVMVINQRFFINGFKGLIRLSPNMDTLVAMGSMSGFVYSVCLLLLLAVDHTASHHFYFESSAMILALITVGKVLESRSKGKTTDALKSLRQLAPETATVIRDDKEIAIPIQQVVAGDIVVVRSGDRIAVDGFVVQGSATVDESALTGESLPVDKIEGDRVSAATLNLSGYMHIRATQVGNDTTLSQIIRMVSDANATKAPIAKLADTVSGIFVPVVMGIAVITLVIWLCLGESIGFALARAISVLVISCPCALGLATPVAIMVGSGIGAKNGILFKTAVSLEQAGKTGVVVLDKTGTITQGKPKVTAILPVDDIDERVLLQTAYSLECKSEHPLSKAIARECEEQGIKPDETTEFQVFTGKGLRANRGPMTLYGGNQQYISSVVTIPSTVLNETDRLAESGHTPLYFATNEQFLGVIAVADVTKDDSKKAVRELQNMGIRVVMLSGDNERTARVIGNRVGINEIIAGVLPDGKEAVIRQLQKNDFVMMVGDGINDAPALARADIGVAIGVGADVAVDAADVVLVNNRLLDVPATIRLSRSVIKTIRENLFWAFVYNIIGIPLAAGVWIPILGWEMDPMFGAAAMSLSSFCVVANALRLNYKNLYSTKHDKKRSSYNKKECVTMTKTMVIEGMMCPHCSGRVKKVLEAMMEIESADVSHESGTAVVTLKTSVDDDVLKSCVESEGYKVVSIS